MDRSGLFTYIMRATENGGGSAVDLDDFGDDDEYFNEATRITYHRLSDDEAVTYNVPDSERDMYFVYDGNAHYIVDANGVLVY